METLEQLERAARQWEVRSQSNVGTAVVVSPPKCEDKVAVGGTGSPAWAGTGGLAQSSLLSACHKSAPKQMFHAAINLLKE